MKNKILIMISIITLSISLGIVGVNGLEEPITDSTPAWPKIFTYKDYEYSIEGIDLKIYEINANDKKTETKEENGMTVTTTTSESGIKYLKGEATKVLNLDPSEFTISPEYKEDKLNKIDTTFINLNLNITKEKLATLLSNEYSHITDEISYIAEIVVNCKFTKIPETYKYFGSIDLTRSLINAFMPELNIGSKVIDITETNSQVIGLINMGLDEDDKPILTYNPKLSEEDASAIMSVNYIVLSSENNLEGDKDPEKAIMFHNLENIEYLIENFNTIEDNTEKEIENIITKEPVKEDQLVKVDNTSASISNGLSILGICIIIIGGTVISYAMIKNKELI